MTFQVAGTAAIQYSRTAAPAVALATAPVAAAAVTHSTPIIPLKLPKTALLRGV
jgi:hypothetical protein